MVAQRRKMDGIQYSVRLNHGDRNVFLTGGNLQQIQLMKGGHLWVERTKKK